MSAGKANNDPAVIRFLDDPALDGRTNMARDEALLHHIGQRQSPPTLRLYQWSAPTISLGYFQRFADYESLQPPLNSLAVVRRLTGGGAILHDLELTYSLVLPIDDPLLSNGPNALYELAHEAISKSLKSLDVVAQPAGFSDDSGPSHGPFFCFERRHRFDLLINHDKIAGSAQRRTRHAVLQHGSIILANRFPQQPTATTSHPFNESVSKLRRQLTVQFHHTLTRPLLPAIWSNAELALATTIQEKYAADDWTKRS